MNKELVLKLIAGGMTVVGTAILEYMKIKKIDQIDSDIYNKVVQDVMKKMQKEEVI